MSSEITLNLTSPDYPQNYADSANCIVFLQKQTSSSSSSSSFIIRIWHLDLERNYDFLMVGTGAQLTDESTFIYLTSTLSPRSLIFPEETIWLRFKSDTSVNRGGFFLQVQIVSTENKTGTHFYE